MPGGIVTTLGLLVSACMVQTGRQPGVPAQVLVAPGMPGGIVTTGGGAPGGPVRTLGAAGLGGGVVNPVYLVKQQPQLSHSSQLVYLQQAGAGVQGLPGYTHLSQAASSGK